MPTVTYIEVRDQAARLADRKRTSLAARESDQFLGYIAAGLRDAWRAAAWPSLLTLEQMTPSGRTLDKRAGTPTELGEVLGIYTANPQTAQEWYDIEFDDNGTTLALAEAADTVWVDWKPPAPNLLRLSEAALNSYEIPDAWLNYLAYRAAGQQLRSDGLHAAGAEYMDIGESDLDFELQNLRLPARLNRIRMVR